MKFSTELLSILSLALCLETTLAHPERLTKESAKSELVGRGTNKCAAQIEARKAAFVEKRAQSLYDRRAAEAFQVGRRDVTPIKRDVYSTIQNDTCVLAPEAG